MLPVIKTIFCFCIYIILEKKFYDAYISKFKEIKQYTFNDTIQYTDCGETTILNVFNYLLLKDDGSFNLEDAGTWDDKLREFYMKYPTIDSMLKVNLQILKNDLSLVFNKRGDHIIYNRVQSQCDINTTMKSIIKTCAFLLNIETNNFQDIFKKLNKSVVDTDISIDFSDLEYKDKFKLTLYNGHAEFNLKFKEIIIDGLNRTDNLLHHWINPIIPFQQRPYAYEYSEGLPNKYSVEHFRFYYWYHPAFFHRFISDAQQTDEICMEAVKITKIFSETELEDGTDETYNLNWSFINFKKVVNKTYAICKAAVISCGDSIRFVPPELKDIDMCKIAFTYNLANIQFIPHTLQDKSMIEKIQGIHDQSNKEQLLAYANPELL